MKNSIILLENTIQPSATEDESPQLQNSKKSLSRLEGGFDLTLHTNLARGLFDGNWKFGRMGLMQFIQITALLWKAYKEDDPYAHWYLLKIYNALQDAQTELKKAENELAQQIVSVRGLKVELFHRSKPLIYALKLTPPFTFLVAQFLEQLDYLMRQLVTLMRMCQLPREKLNHGELTAKAQKIFSLPREWHYTGVTRTDMLSHTLKAEQAKARMKVEVPLAILNKEIHLPFLPALK